VVKLTPLHLDPNSEISKHASVFFDFDKAAVRTQDQAVVVGHGTYLAKNPALKAAVEGNADERGGREYNLALGQRRAQAVVDALAIAGANKANLEAVSLGKDKPLAQGHDEAAWAQNRRADIKYK
jgi:peptidoglycan-associated lipoprotein